MSKPLLKNLALLVVTLVLTLVVCEYAARFVFRDITTTADNRSYFAQKWKAANVHLNSQRYREREFERAKPAGVFRMAFIGDSFTFGQGIAVDERMSNRIERELKQQHPSVEVLNFGNAGNNTADELAVLKTLLSTGVNPDFVLLQWYINDVEYKEPSAAQPGGASAPGSLLGEVRLTMRNTSVLYFLAGEVWHRVVDAVSGNYAQDMAKQYGDPDSFVSKEADKALAEFFATCKSRQIPVGVVLVPSMAPLTPSGYAFGYLHDRVLSSCKRAGVTCVDLLNVFQPYLSDRRNVSKLWVNKFDSHMSGFANQLAAAKLMEVFGPAWNRELRERSSSGDGH